MADVAYNFIILAQQFASHNSFKKAFDMFMCAFDKQPHIKKRFEFEFRAVLSRMNEELAGVDNKADIFANFERAIKMFPGNVQLLNVAGRYLYRYGYFPEALCHFEKALNIDHSIVSIEKNLNNSKCFLFPRSQFRQLNDRIRNDAYRRAISSCVTPAVDSVLDIDTGTGLLALYANECNPVAITACEASSTMARLAECVMQDNNARDVVIINKPPVVLNHYDIYGTRSVLLTDTIDSGLFGEHILQSICHARENLLQENSKIIPGRAEFFVAGINCEELNKKYKLCRETKDILNISDTNVHTTTFFGATYYSEDVNSYDSLKYMTEPQSLLEIDFNNYQDVCEKLHRQEPYIAKLTAIDNGEINMLVGWFNLHLTEDIMITSDPTSESKSNAWLQAIFFDLLPKTLRKHETTNVPFITYGGSLTTLPEINTTIKRISPETLAFLNDFEYMDMIRKSMATVCVHLGQTVDVSLVDIVDLSPFPMFGVLLMKRGANSLICHVKTGKDKTFLLAVLQANGIPEEKVTILISDSCRTHEVFKEKKFHVIFSNIIEFSGDLDVRRKGIFENLKQEHLISGGLCLPVSVTIMGQLISSKWLEINNRVLDENVDYRMAEHVNRYQISQAVYLDIARMEYETLSEAIEISCCSDMKSEVINVTVAEDGECNAILCWYKVQLLDEWNEIYTNRSNSFVESMAYMMSPNVKVFCGDQANVLKCVGPDGSFQLVLDMEPY